MPYVAFPQALKMLEDMEDSDESREGIYDRADEYAVADAPIMPMPPYFFEVRYATFSYVRSEKGCLVEGLLHHAHGMAGTGETVDSFQVIHRHEHIATEVASSARMGIWRSLKAARSNRLPRQYGFQWSQKRSVRGLQHGQT